jgi:hypothetical protein
MALWKPQDVLDTWAFLAVLTRILALKRFW